MRAGAVLDRRYRIDAKLAAGGFGAIYRATDLVMGREVALKVLHTELVDDPNVVERFRREAVALARLRDPHTVTMYDLGEAEDGTLYIVMELLRGESLHDLFHAHGQRLPWRRVTTIARGVCSSLREAHSLGVVHRDLKPANIHLERHALGNDHVKVLDFGIAKLVGTSEPYRDLTLHGQMVGTFDYMAPEQLIGGVTTGKTDVFTLGVVIYEMIAGERPYGDARGPASMLMTLLGTTPVPLAERATVPPALDAIVMRAIQREPELRPDIFELDETLAAILDTTVELDLARSATAVAMAARAESESESEADSDAALGDADTDVGAEPDARADSAFDDAEARFGSDDGPTWIDEIRPLRRTPTNLRPTPNSLRPPAKRAGEGDTSSRPPAKRAGEGDTSSRPPAKRAGEGDTSSRPPAKRAGEGGSGSRPAAKLSGPAPTVIGTFARVTPARGVPVIPLAPLTSSITPARGVAIAPPPTSPREFAVGSATQIPPVPTTAAESPLAPSRMPSGTTPIVNESRTTPIANESRTTPIANKSRTTPIANESRTTNDSRIGAVRTSADPDMNRTPDADSEPRPAAPLRVRFVSKPTVDPHHQVPTYVPRSLHPAAADARPERPTHATPARRPASATELAGAVGGSAAASSAGAPLELARTRRRDAIVLAIAYIVLATLVAGGIYLMY